MIIKIVILKLIQIDYAHVIVKIVLRLVPIRSIIAIIDVNLILF